MYKVLLYHYRDNFDTDFPTEADHTLYDDTLPSDEVTILTGAGKNPITELPTFDFTILPSHPLYDEIVKFKTWITVYRKTTVLFHGRVISDGGDFYGQKTVSCEGALGCLIDSIVGPLSSVTETPKAHLQRLIAAHNALMMRTPNPEPYKCFTVGNVTITEANSSKKFEKVEGYSQTRSLIDDHLIKDYKGYLFARYESGTLYLDWLKEFNRVNDQPVKMAVNMLDRTIEESADEYYTIMLPVGSKNITIDGTYLEDSSAINKYGRIYKAESFGDSKKKADLLAKAQKEFNKRGTNLPLSVHIKAVDMSMLGGDVDELLAGDKLTNVEDRTGALFTDLTIAEHNYDIFNPANDEFVVENQEAIDKRHTSSGNGTISSRAGRGSRDLFEETRDLYRHYHSLTLKVDDDYTLSANSIHELSKYHEIITGIFDLLADESNVRTETDNVKTVKFKTFYPNHNYGYGDYVRRTVGDVTKTYMFVGPYTAGMGWDAAVEAGLVVETNYGESIDVKSIYGTHTHQDETGLTTVIQDVTGIELTKTRPEITDFNTNTEYKEGDYVRYNEKVFRCLYPHKGKFNGDHFSYVAEVEDESKIWKYQPVYKTDELGNTVMNLITGEAEYDVVDGNIEGIPVTNPIKSITRRTQTEFYDVIGTTDTYQSVTDEFDPKVNYAVGRAVKHDGKFYRFVQAHPGSDQNPLPWDWDHVEPLTDTTVVNGVQVYTMTSIDGSTLFHNEKEIDQIVGEVEVVQTKDASGKVVSKDLIIKNGSGIRSQKDGVEVGIFENGSLNAGLMVNSLNSKSTDIVAIAFSSSKSYSVGDYVTYNGKVYRCTTAHQGAWNANHFTEASGKIAKLKADIVDLGDYATVGELNAKTVKAENIFSTEARVHEAIYVHDITVDEGGDITTTDLYATNVVDAPLISGEEGEFGTISAETIVIGEDEVNLSNSVYAIQTYSGTGSDKPPEGMIGFKYSTVGDPTTFTPVNFNIASTQTYLDGVEAAKKSVTLDSTGWCYDADENDMYLQVTASSPNTNSKTIYLPSLRHTITGNNVSIEARDKDAQYHEVHSLTIPSRSGTITNIDYSGGDPVYDNNGGYDFNVKASGTNITGVGPYSLHLDATDAVEHGENSVVPVTAVTSGAVATSNAKAEKGNVTYTGNGTIGLIFYFTLSNGKKYKYSTSVSVGGTAYDPRTYTLQVVKNSDGSKTNLSIKKFYFYKIT